MTQVPAQQQPLAEATDIFDMLTTDWPPTPWLIPGFLARGWLTVLFAPGGAGKSTIALRTAAVAALGAQWPDWRAREQVRVLYVCTEDDLAEQTRRARALCAAEGIDASEALAGRLAFLNLESRTLLSRTGTGRFGALQRTQTFNELQAQILRHQYGLVVLDPAIELSDSLDENTATDMRALSSMCRDLAREANCAVLLLHHERKQGWSERRGDADDEDGLDGADAMRGSGALAAAARVVFRVAPRVSQNVTNRLAPAAEWYVRLQCVKTNSWKREGHYYAMLPHDAGNEETRAAAVPARKLQDDPNLQQNVLAHMSEAEVSTLIEHTLDVLAEGIPDPEVGARPWSSGDGPAARTGHRPDEAIAAVAGVSRRVAWAGVLKAIQMGKVEVTHWELDRTSGKGRAKRSCKHALVPIGRQTRWPLPAKRER